MTIFEHPMLAVNSCLAAGLNRRWGWPIVATAGVAAVLPDLDTLTIVCGVGAFDRLHRVIAHNLFAACLLGGVWAAADYRWRLTQRLRSRFWRPAPSASEGTTPGCPPCRPATLCVWVAVGVAASLSHLAVDLFVSGHELHGAWELQLLWPFSSRSWAYPTVHWGDPVPTAIFALGMFAMFRWRERVRSVAIATLATVGVYFLVRGLVGY